MAEEDNNQTKNSTDSSSAAPAPQPSTTIAPSAPPLNDGTVPYLEAPTVSPGSPTLPGSSSFLATSAPSLPSSPSAPTDIRGSDQDLGAVPGDLATLKQQALQNLAPLIDKLDQPPADRFKTLMMMIQASDNPQYLDEAYAAANKISDEKAKAQALLDIVNEINYFAQSQKTNQ